MLVFASEPLRAPLDVLGPVHAVLHVRASTGHAHVFARLVPPEIEVYHDHAGVRLCCCPLQYDLPRTIQPAASPYASYLNRF